MTLVPHSSRESKMVEQFPTFDHNPLPLSERFPDISLRWTFRRGRGPLKPGQVLEGPVSVGAHNLGDDDVKTVVPALVLPLGLEMPRMSGELLQGLEVVLVIRPYPENVLY